MDNKYLQGGRDLKSKKEGETHMIFPKQWWPESQGAEIPLLAFTSQLCDLEQVKAICQSGFPCT